MSSVSPTVFIVDDDPSVRRSLSRLVRQAGLEVDANEIVRIPTNNVAVDDVDTARKVLDLMERLDDHDDVQSVAANFSIPDEALAQLG